MPIYEYTCKQCGNFEIMQRITEDPLKKCPTCGSKVAKLISRSAFHLKGSGWYVTNYGKNGSKSGKTVDAQPAGTEAKTIALKDNGSSATPSCSSATSSTTKESAAAS